MTLFRPVRIFNWEINCLCTISFNTFLSIIARSSLFLMQSLVIPSRQPSLISQRPDAGQRIEIGPNTRCQHLGPPPPPRPAMNMQIVQWAQQYFARPAGLTLYIIPMMRYNSEKRRERAFLQTAIAPDSRTLEADINYGNNSSSSRSLVDWLRWIRSFL